MIEEITIAIFIIGFIAFVILAPAGWPYHNVKHCECKCNKCGGVR